MPSPIDLDNWMALPDETVLTVQDVARIPRCCGNTVRSEIHDGVLSGFKVGGSYRVWKRALVDYIEGNTIGPQIARPNRISERANATVKRHSSSPLRGQGPRPDVPNRRRGGRTAQSSATVFGREYRR
jgi:hypothetical protein